MKRADNRRRSWRFFRPQFEPLENRLAPATWDGGGDGFSWFDARNWNNDTLPAFGEDVFIGAGGAIEIRGGQADVGLFSSQRPLEINNGGILTVAASLVLTQPLTMNQGGLHARGAAAVNLDVQGPLDLFQSSISANGRLSVIGNGVVRQSTLRGDVGLDLLGTLNSEQTGFSTLPQGLIRNLGTLNLAGGRFDIGPNLENHGNIRATGMNDTQLFLGNTTIKANAAITIDLHSGDSANFNFQSLVNEMGGLVDVKSPVQVSFTSGAFLNQGTLRRSGDEGLVNFDSPISNSGVVEVLSGDLRFGRGGSQSGVFDVSDGNHLFLEGAASTKHTLNTGAMFQGEGTTHWVNGELEIQGMPEIGPDHKFHFENGTMTGPGMLEVNGDLEWLSGVWNSAAGAGSVDIEPFGSIVIDTGGGPFLDGRTLNNAGQGILRGTSGEWRVNGIFNNEVSGVFDIQTNRMISTGSPSSVITNRGKVLKTIGTLKTVVQPSFETLGGTLEVNEGFIELAKGIHENGKFMTGPQGRLIFKGNHTFQNQPSSLAGAAQLSQGMFDLDTSFTIPAGARLEMDVNSVIDGPGKLTVAGTLAWLSGMIKGPAEGNAILDVLAGGVLDLRDAGACTLEHRTVNLAGTALFHGVAAKLTLGQGTVFNNLVGGLFEVKNNNTIEGSGQFINQGTFRKASGPGTTFSANLTNAADLELLASNVHFTNGYTQTGGATRLLGGTLSAVPLDSSPAIFLQGGRFLGNGNFSGRVVNTGASFEPGTSAGTLTHTSGRYSQSDMGKLVIEIGGLQPGTQFDQFLMANTFLSPKLGGTLEIRLLNGFVPSPGDRFPILTMSGVTGDFETIVGDNQAGVSFDREFLPTLAFPNRLELVVGAARPVARADAFVVQTGQTLNVPAPGLLGNDGGNQIQAELVTPPQLGTLRLNANGSFTYRPRSNFRGPDTFTYRVRDGDGVESDPATVTLLANLGFRGAVSAGSEATTAVNIPVVLSAALAQPVMVQYAVTGGTAAGDGVDYALAAGTLTFNPGQTSRTIPVQVVNDRLDEDDETIFLTLTNPVGAGFSAFTTHTYTIRDNDPPPKVQFRRPKVAVTENVAQVALEVFLSAASSREVRVNFAVTGGTAVNGADYNLINGALVFAPGETTKTIVITLINDQVDERTETVRLALAGPVGAALGTNKTHTLSILDDDPAA